MNFNAMVSQIQSELNDYSARSKTRIEGWINESHKQICQQRSWGFLNIKQSDQMTLGTANFPLSILTGIKVATVTTEAKEIRAIYDITDGTFDEVKQSTMEQVRAAYQMDYSQDGSPEYWYFVSDNMIQVYPLLSADRIFQFSFKKKLITYVSGAATALLIPDDYIDTLKERVLYRAYRFKSDERAEQALQAYKDLLAGMIAAEASKAGIIEERTDGFTSRFADLVVVP